MALQVVGAKRIASAELSLVAEQLWPGLGGGDLRVSTGASSDPSWVTIEQHALGLWRGDVAMVLPHHRRVATRALRQYRNLRSGKRQLERWAWGRAIATGHHALWGTIALEARRGSAAAQTTTPVQELVRSLGQQEAHFAMSVRRTANRKALLQVVDTTGATVGFAKLGRNPVSSRGVRREGQALGRLQGGNFHLKTPSILCEGEVNGHPYILIEPLPPDIYRIEKTKSGGPTTEELAAIAPVHRHAVPAQTIHFKSLIERAAALDGVANVREGLNALNILLHSVETESRLMPVAAYWHGDFAYWNTGRTATGQMWCWDFENGEDDALLGLDVLHWYASKVREQHGSIGLAHWLPQAELEDLRKCGLDASDQRILRKVYGAEIIARTLEMASLDGWSSVWAGQSHVLEIARSVAG